VKDLAGDTPSTVATVLECFRTCVLEFPWADPSVLARFFNGYMLEHLVRLYEVPDSGVSDQVHAFLADWVASEMRRGTNADRTKVSGPAEPANRTKQRLLTLSRLISRLKPTQSSKQRQLVLTVITAFPALIVPYLHSLRYAYEPRPSPQWFANVEVYVSVITVALSAPCDQTLPPAFLTDDHVPFDASPAGLVRDILPPGLTKSLLALGLQHNDSAVRFTTLHVLHLVFRRYEQLRDHSCSSTSLSREVEDSGAHSELHPSNSLIETSSTMDWTRLERDVLGSLAVGLPSSTQSVATTAERIAVMDRQFKDALM